MKCPNCGSEVGNAKFCPECGTAISAVTDNNSSKGKEESPKRKRKG
jgi:hypothetical protein